MGFAALQRHYRNAAIVVLNLIIGLVVLNGLLYVAIGVRYRFFHPDRDNAVMQRYFDQSWAEVYPGMSTDDIDRLLHETWSRGQRFDPVTGHAERQYDGVFINVSEFGIRSNGVQHPWPPTPDAFNLFLFGGSTTFGYGVADDQTLAAYLERSLERSLARNVRVYNFGCSSLHSLSERARFEYLLTDGYVPDLALFVDGLNEFAHKGGWGDGPRAGQNWGRSGYPWLAALERTPMVRTARALKRRAARFIKRTTAVATRGDVEPGASTQFADIVIQRYLANQRLVRSSADIYNVPVVFVWQPVPMYRYDLDNHLFAAGGFPDNPRVGDGYERFSLLRTTLPLDEEFFWCADMQEGVDELLYVDKIHYSSRMNDLLAEEITEWMRIRGVLEPSSPNETQGSAR